MFNTLILIIRPNNVTTAALNVGTCSTCNASFPKVAIDANNTVVVVWTETVGTSNNLYVKRLVGNISSGNWELVGGGALDISLANNASPEPPAIAMTNGRLAVGWVEINSTNSAIRNFYVKSNYTTTWQPLGGALDNTVTNSAIDSSITRKSDNTSVVAWLENGADIYVKEWNGTQWSLLGGVVDSPTIVSLSPDVVMRSD